MRNIIISFDLWNTLISANKSFGSIRNWLLSSIFNISIDDAHSIVKSCKQEFDDMALHGEQWSYQNIYKHLINKTSVDPTSIDVDSLIDSFQHAFLQHVPTTPVGLPDAISSLLNDLSKKDIAIKFYLISNNNFIKGSTIDSCVLPLLHPIKFEKTFHSADMLYAKPSTYLLDHIVSFFDDSPYIHIGDNTVCDDFSSYFTGKDRKYNNFFVSNPGDLVQKINDKKLFDLVMEMI